MFRNKLFLFVVMEYGSRCVEMWRARSVLQKTAPGMMILGVSLLTDTWQDFIVREAFGYFPSGGDTGDGGIGVSAYAGIFLIVISAVFIIISYFLDKATHKEKLIFDKKISDPVKVGSSNVYCYCGSVTQISGIDVVVTSENTDFDLGGRSSTSVSGRVRHMAATRGADGSVVHDNLAEWVRNWKLSHSKQGELNLGACVVCDDPFEAKSNGIREIILAVAIRKNPTGIATIDREAIQRIVNFSITHCVERGYKSVFIPVFGLGSGNVSPAMALGYTLGAIKNSLCQSTECLDVYVGVYRLMDVIKLGGVLGKWN